MKTLENHDGFHSIGQAKIISSLKRGMNTNRITHAHLLAGPRNVGKMTLALDIARMMNCEDEAKPCGRCNQCTRIERGLHTDVRIVGRASQKTSEVIIRTVISIDQVRSVQREANLKPYEGRHRIFIFDGAEHLSEEAANCLLKILEEPPRNVIFILLTCNPSSLLPTILSRCQKLELRLMPISTLVNELKGRYDVDSQKALEIARLSGGRFGWAVRAIRQPDFLNARMETLDRIADLCRERLIDRFLYADSLASLYIQDRESARADLELHLEWWRDIMLIKEGMGSLVTNLSLMDVQKRIADPLTSTQVFNTIRTIEKTFDLLETNVNPRLALEEMMLALPQ